MKRTSPRTRKPAAALLCATLLAALLPVALPAHADDRAELEQLRATTLGLIDAMVDAGMMSREKADKLLRDAEAKAKVRLAEMPAVAPAPAPELGIDGKRVVRVPYVPESVKREIREQIKQEVLVQAKGERWGEPGVLPDWMDRFSFEGDMRVRYENTGLDRSNTAPGAATYSDGTSTRAADIATGASAFGNPNFNTQNDSSRARLRARLGVNATVSDSISAGLRITTGNTNNRVSTNQSLGQNFNKYSLVLDRGYLKLDPLPWLTVSGGRIANPWFSSDLVWADDLNFEGIAATARATLSPSLASFVTAGWFPLREDTSGSLSSRDLLGVQGGVEWTFGQRKNRLKLGAALYEYRNIEGRAEDNASLFDNPDYATRNEYGAGLRQRGNTLFLQNAPDDSCLPGAPCLPASWGLASKFRELNVTGSLDLASFDPVHVVVSGDFVKNLAFDRNEIARRTGFRVEDGKDIGYMAKLQVGAAQIARRGDWNVSLAYRYLGSDAVLDAFTNADFGLGGTNNKGTILGFNYGIDKNAWITARWLSSDVIDPMVPKRAGTDPFTKLSVDVLQIDLNARF